MAWILFQVDILRLILQAKPIPLTALAILILASIFSWAIIFAKWRVLKEARESNLRFLRAFRKAPNMGAVALAVEQYRPAPLASVFEFGYEEVSRQVKARGLLVNKLAAERMLQLGINTELSRLEKHLNWLATIAAVSPFVGLFGTVWGIIDAFQGLGMAGSVSLRAVAPGIAEALVATAMGLGAAIPAAVFYNIFGSSLRDISAHMEDFALEFMNMAEREFGE